MILPTNHEMLKLLKDQPDVVLREYHYAIQAELERRKNEARENYERKFAVIFQHMKENGFNLYINNKKLDIEEIEICDDGEL